MKCVCGYYHMEDWEIEREDAVFQDELRKNNGSKEFIRLGGQFTIGNDHRDLREVKLYVCPECGTVHMERW